MKIYKIISDLPDGRFLCYIGSTKGELKTRLKRHELNYKSYLKGKYNYTTAYELIKKNWYEMSLVEDLGNCDKREMLNKESYYINYYKNQSDEYKVVNLINPNCLDIVKYKKYMDNYMKKYYKTEKYKEYLKSRRKKT